MGGFDVSILFKLPTKIYGRTNEQQVPLFISGFYFACLLVCQFLLFLPSFPFRSSKMFYLGILNWGRARLFGYLVFNLSIFCYTISLTSIIFFIGESGIGKSSLIHSTITSWFANNNSTHTDTTNNQPWNRACFLEGKFGIYHRGTPYRYHPWNIYLSCIPPFNHS